MFPSSCPGPARRAAGSGSVPAAARDATGPAARLVPRMARTRAAAAVRLGMVALVTGTTLAHAQVPQTVNGIPQQVIPTYPEQGAPTFTISPGTPTTGGTSGQGTGDSGGTGTGTTDGSSDALNTMLGQPWGSAAVNSAQTLGVSASALAATCVLESGCQNVGGSGTISGAFQMSSSTYNSSLAAALAQDPSLASSVVPGTAGQMDPATESAAASEYILQNAQTLESAGISSPTVLQVRGGYNFGPQNGVNLAQAPDNAPFSSVVSGLSASTLAANGITSGETVGQWRQSVVAKIGSTANASALSA